MSNLSTLSHEYAANASFADEINTLILKLKKYYFKTKGMENIHRREIEKTQQKIAEFLEGILAELKPETLKSEIVKKRVGLVPAEIIERIKHLYRNTMDYYVEDVKELINVLNSNKQIDTKEFELLDSLCDAADSITSTSFRRLWRR